MYAEKDLTKEQYDAAIASKPADYVRLTAPTQGCKASAGTGSQYFCDYAVQVVKEMDQLGSTPKERAAAWRTGGYKIQTTLNLDLNSQQKELIDSYAPNTETRFQLGGVIDSVEADTGHILTMAQNKNYNQLPNSPSTDSSINFSVDEQYGGGEGFQTGSTFKLFTLLDWLQQGHGLNESVNGTPRAFSTYNVCGSQSGIGNGYTPKNDEGSERGFQSVETATYRSVNVAYVAMAQKLDYCDIRKTASALGVHLAKPRAPIAGYGDDMSQKTTTQVNLNASAVLGTNYIAPLTMAAAYAGVANNGVFCEPIAIVNVTSPSGKSLGGQPKNCTQAIDPSIAQAAVYALKQVLTRGTAAGGSTYDGYQEFAKTGTTDEADQIWLIGSTTKVATATWLGNIEGKQSLRRVAGPHGTYSLSRTSLWRQAQAIVNATYPGGAFQTPNSSTLNGNSISIPDVTGKSADEARSALAGAGFTYVDGGTQPGGGTAGTVSSTAPAAGSLSSRGSSVTVYTSDGSQATMPNVAGKSAGDARAALSDSGFTNVQVADQFEKGDDKNACTVAATDPASGTAASKSAQVTVKLYGTKDGKDPGNCK
jgi:membrane peptidoglycan carboxypeptidase